MLLDNNLMPDTTRFLPGIALAFLLSPRIKSSDCFPNQSSCTQRIEITQNSIRLTVCSFLISSDEFGEKMKVVILWIVESVYGQMICTCDLEWNGIRKEISVA